MMRHVSCILLLEWSTTIYIHVKPYLFITFHLDVLVSMEDLYHTELQTTELRFSGQVRGSSYPRMPQSQVHNKKLPKENRPAVNRTLNIRLLKYEC